MRFDLARWCEGCGKFKSIVGFGVSQRLRGQSQPLLSERSEIARPVHILGGLPTEPVRVAGTERIARWHVGQTEEWKEPRDRRLEEVSVLQFGELTEDGSSPLVRVHSACLTGDTLGSLRCDCGPQLESSISQISNAASGGLLVYMTDHEGREDRNTSWL